MNKLMQEAPQSFRGRMYQRDNARPKEQRTLVLKTGIAGLQFNVENEYEQAALDAITPGTELLLFREPDNEYDAWAIAVYRTKTDKLGFITRFKNETIARLMDAGKKFVCMVDEPETDPEAAEIAEKERHRNRRAATENMSLPLSVYLVEDSYA